MSDESQLSLVQSLLLLALWDLGEGEFSGAKVPKTAVKNRVSKAKAQDLDALMGSLGFVAADGKENRKDCVCLTEAGKAALAGVLRSEGFQFGGNTGARTVNALLRWIRVMGSATVAAAPVAQIESYEAFKDRAIDVLTQLNADFQLNNIIAIYRLRRSLGDCVTRSNFNEWLMEMHRQSVIDLVSGDMPELKPDIAEDSLKSKLGTVYYYIQLL